MPPRIRRPVGARGAAAHFGTFRHMFPRFGVPPVPFYAFQGASLPWYAPWGLRRGVWAPLYTPPGTPSQPQPPAPTPPPWSPKYLTIPFVKPLKPPFDLSTKSRFGPLPPQFHQSGSTSRTALGYRGPQELPLSSFGTPGAPFGTPNEFQTRPPNPPMTFTSDRARDSSEHDFNEAMRRSI